MPETTEKWDVETDVLVVGSGGGVNIRLKRGDVMVVP